MSRLKELHIDAYRSLHAIQLGGFRSMNLLVGGNNVGKTSILEAIGLVARPFDPAQWVQTVTNRDASGPLVDGLWGMFPGSTTIALETGEDWSERIEIRADFGGGDRRLSAAAAVFVEQWTDIGRGGPEAQVDAVVRIQADVNVVEEEGGHHRHVMDFHSTPKRVPVGSNVPSIRVFMVTPSTHRSTQQLTAYLSHAIDLGAKEKSVELLRLFDEDIEDVLISRPFGRDAIRLQHRTRGIVDLSTFGDGTRRAFAMSLALARASGGLLLVDEIEASIHAKALDVMLPWLARAAMTADVQLVVTTHSLEAVDAVLRAFDDEEPGVVAYHLRRTESGHACRRYDLAGLRDIRDEGLDIR